MPIPNPKVSILIPVYNREILIGDCIQSALEQTFTDFEIVLVDNASTDNTWAICQQFALRDSRIRVFRNETNVGPVRNWIRCVQKARGEYSKMLFSDDLIEAECVERLLLPLINPDVGLVFCAARIGESRSKSVIAYSAKEDSIISYRKYLGMLLAFQFR